MKRIPIAILTLAALCAAGGAAAQDGKALAKPGAPPAACCADAKAQMAQMNEHMARMRTLHDQLAKASTPQERQKLMDEQHREMQQGMALMDNMRHDGAMMGGGGMAMGQKGKPADQAMQMQMMQARMDMMQTMMRTMMDQQAAGGATMAAPAK